MVGMCGSASERAERAQPARSDVFHRRQWARSEQPNAGPRSLIREYVYLYGAVSPKDGTCVYLIMPAPDTECFQIFLDTLAKKYPRHFILLFVDGAGNHHGDELVIPVNIMLHLLPPYSPELNPQENLWDEIREKIFKNYALNRAIRKGSISTPTQCARSPDHHRDRVLMPISAMAPAEPWEIAVSQRVADRSPRLYSFRT